MRYYLDTEFDGFGGPLISLALVREDGESLYLVYQETATDPWVQANVIPLLWRIPSPLPGMAYRTDQESGAHIIADFIAGDMAPMFISDWPDDIAYLCKALITGPGQMVQTVEAFGFMVRRVDAYPTALTGAVQHNAWWDAAALRHLLAPPPITTKDASTQVRDFPR